MRICFFHLYGVHAESGGISRITSNLTDLFRSKGIEVFFIGFKKQSKEIRYDRNQYFLPNNSCLNSSENSYFISNFIINNNIDILINQTSLSRDSTSLLNSTIIPENCKMVSCIHNSLLTPIKNYAYQKEYLLKRLHLDLYFHVLNSRVGKGLLMQLYKKKERNHYQELVSFSDKVVSLVPDLEDELKEIVNINFKDKSIIIPNCINVDKEVQLKKKNRILWVGTVDFSVKKIDYMLAIWATIFNHLPDWELQILGDGPSLKEAMILAQNNKLDRITFLGRRNPESYYDEAAILVVTSSHESFSLVSVEAMSKGVVPVINNSFPAARYITNNGKAGVLAEAFNKKDISKKIINLCNNHVKRELLQKEALLYCKNFSSENIYHYWESLFTSLYETDK